MPDIILHHYESSPFSEKIRAILGCKKLTWQSVIISPIMPRPELMPLTGGYRRTPVLQIGADIYCDTAVIAAHLDSLAPSPRLYPDEHVFAAAALASWADHHLFLLAVSLCFQPRALEHFAANRSAAEMEAFFADRAKLAAGARGLTQATPEVAQAHLDQYLTDMHRQLCNGRVFLFGNQPCIADFSVYHCLWFLSNNALTAKLLAGYDRVCEWMAAIRHLGHGQYEDLTSTRALEVATGADPAPCKALAQDLPAGIALGNRVQVTPTDYGLQPVQGQLLRADLNEIVLARTDPNAGRVHVHFPRAWFELAMVQSNPGSAQTGRENS